MLTKKVKAVKKIAGAVPMLKTSQEVYDHFSKQEIKDGVIEYKGGHGVVKNGVVKEIFVGEDTLNKATKRLKELK